MKIGSIVRLKPQFDPMAEQEETFVVVSKGVRKFGTIWIKVESEFDGTLFTFKKSTLEVV